MQRKSKKPPGRPFRKGDPRAGRPKGTPNKVTVQMREFALGLLDRPQYRENFLEAWDSRKLPPQLEAMVYHYAHGKPKETVEHTGPDGGPLQFDRIELVLVSGKSKG